MNTYSSHRRQTGRTTRLLKEAKRLAREGKAVYVIAANQHDAARLQKLVDADMPGSSIKCESPGSMGRGLDWETLLIPGRRCEVLVDHYAIERKYASVLEMLTRFDEPSA